MPYLTYLLALIMHLHQRSTMGLRQWQYELHYQLRVRDGVLASNPADRHPYAPELRKSG